MRIVARDDGEHQRADKEALNLDPATTKDLDEEDCEKVARYVACGRDDEISVGVFQERVVFGFAFGETDGRQEHRLVEIEAVKGDVDEEPARCGSDQLFQMFPLAKIYHERLHLYILGRWCDVCFDDGCVSVLGGKFVGVGIRVYFGPFAGVVHGGG